MIGKRACIVDNSIKRGVSCVLDRVGTQLRYEALDKVIAIFKIARLERYALSFIGELLSETSSSGNDFLSKTTKLWEESSDKIESLNIRRVLLRIGIVLSLKGGALPKTAFPLHFCIGSYFGNGQQFYSWIHIDDLCKMFVFAIENKELKGVFNSGSESFVSYSPEMLSYCVQDTAVNAKLYHKIMEKNFMDFTNNKVSTFIKGYGLNSGKNIINWVESLLIRKGYSKNITFSELYKRTNIHYKIMVTNLNKHKLEKFDYIDTPKIKVTKAIRMAISIPFAFSVLTYKNDIYVDAALINNFPINLYENKENILGIDFLYSKKEKNEVIDTLDKYIYNVILCYISVKEDQTREERSKENILEFFIDNISALDFNLSYEDKQKMIDYGYDELDKYFKNTNTTNKLNAQIEN